jgi:hypothetical protein
VSNTYGIEVPGRHAGAPHRAPVRYLVVIDEGGTTLARLFLADREAAGEIDAGTDEVVQMMHGLVPVLGAGGPEWDRALAGHSTDARAGARVFTLAV